MTKETYIRSVLECNFAGFKEEIIESAIQKIMEYTDEVEPIIHCIDSISDETAQKIIEEANKACANCQEWICDECEYKHWRNKK